MVENDADVNFTLAKKVLDKLVSGEWHQINFLEVYSDIRLQRRQAVVGLPLLTSAKLGQQWFGEPAVSVINIADRALGAIGFRRGEFKNFGDEVLATYRSGHDAVFIRIGANTFASYWPK